MKALSLCLTSSLLLLACAGCMHGRSVSITDVPDSGRVIVTRNKYCLVDYQRADGSRDALQDLLTLRAEMEHCYPGVFSAQGAPFILREGPARERKSKYGITVLFPYVCTLGIFPFFHKDEFKADFTVELERGGAVAAPFQTLFRREYAFSSLSPMAFMWYNEHEKLLGAPTFYSSIHASEKATCQGIAYGVAVRLKALEDELVTHAPPVVERPPLP